MPVATVNRFPEPYLQLIAIALLIGFSICKGYESALQRETVGSWLRLTRTLSGVAIIVALTVCLATLTNYWMWKGTIPSWPHSPLAPSWIRVFYVGLWILSSAFATFLCGLGLWAGWEYRNRRSNK